MGFFCGGCVGVVLRAKRKYKTPPKPNQKNPLIYAYLEERLLGKGGEEACSLAVSAWSKQEPRNESETHGGGDGVRQKRG